MKEGIELGGHQTESLWQGFRTRGSREAPLLPPARGLGDCKPPPRNVRVAVPMVTQASSAFRWRKAIVGESGASPWEV